MPIKIKNWKLAILALCFFCLLFGLGCWQLARSQQKKLLLQSFADRTAQTPLNSNALSRPGDWRFYRATLHGHFDNSHTLLLDNKIFHGQVGYQVYTPFVAQGISQPILVDRGFVPAGRSRQILPTIPAIEGKTTITGLLNLPPTYVALGALYDSPSVQWPLRVEFINLSNIGELLSTDLFRYTLSLDKDSNQSKSLSTEWQIVTITPEKHLGYAIQWFALALTLLIIFVALNRK